MAEEPSAPKRSRWSPGEPNWQVAVVRAESVAQIHETMVPGQEIVLKCVLVSVDEGRRSTEVKSRKLLGAQFRPVSKLVVADETGVIQLTVWPDQAREAQRWLEHTPEKRFPELLVSAAQIVGAGKMEPWCAALLATVRTNVVRWEVSVAVSITPTWPKLLRNSTILRAPGVTTCVQGVIQNVGELTRNRENASERSFDLWTEDGWVVPTRLQGIAAEKELQEGERVTLFYAETQEPPTERQAEGGWLWLGSSGFLLQRGDEAAGHAHIAQGGPRAPARRLHIGPDPRSKQGCRGCGAGRPHHARFADEMPVYTCPSCKCAKCRSFLPRTPESDTWCETCAFPPCQGCGCLRPKEDKYHAKHKHMRRWKCPDCQKKACPKCGKAKAVAGTAAKNAWCQECAYPPCQSCGAPRPRDTRYHAKQVPGWQCSGCVEKTCVKCGKALGKKVRANAWCKACAFPPCHAGCGKPRGSRKPEYHAKNMPHWTCPSCRAEAQKVA